MGGKSDKSTFVNSADQSSKKKQKQHRSNNSSNTNQQQHQRPQQHSPKPQPNPKIRDNIPGGNTTSTSDPSGNTQQYERGVSSSFSTPGIASHYQYYNGAIPPSEGGETKAASLTAIASRKALKLEIKRRSTMASVVLKSLSILLGIFFIFVGTTKLTPRVSKELYKDLVSNHTTQNIHRVIFL